MTACSSANSKNSNVSYNSGKRVFIYFLLFFSFIAAVNVTFITFAVKTQSGVVTDKAYEKGLSYDGIIEEAKAQSRIGLSHKARYEDGLLIWNLHIKNGMPLNNAKVTAKFFRPSHTGYDFSIELAARGRGLYEAKPVFPLAGIWTVKLEARWLNSQLEPTIYNTTLELISP